LSDTPRTDALYKEWNGEQPYPPEYVKPHYPRSVWELCKELEHELAAALKVNERFVNLHKALMAEVDKRLDGALKENEELRHDIARHVAIAAELATANEAMKK
jgi:hypothetical protein